MNNEKQKKELADGLTRRGFLTLGGVAGSGSSVGGMFAAGVFGKLGGRCCDGCERGRRRRRTCPVAVGRLLSLARQSS